MGPLRSLIFAAGDLVIVASAFAEYVAFERYARRAVDRTGGDCGIVPPVAFPEQDRTAFAAEAAARILARAKPFEPARFGEGEVFVLGRGPF